MATEYLKRAPKTAASGEADVRTARRESGEDCDSNNKAVH